MTPEIFNDRETRELVFDAMIDLWGLHGKLPETAEMVQWRLYDEGYKEAAYEIQKNFFVGKREPGKTDWDPFMFQFYEYRGMEDEHDFICEAGLEALEMEDYDTEATKEEPEKLW